LGSAPVMGVADVGREHDGKEQEAETEGSSHEALAVVDMARELGVHMIVFRGI